MSASLYADLAWLPRAEGFNADCKALAAGTGPAGAALRRLATQALSEPQMRRLAGLARDLRAQGRPLEPLVPLKLGIIGNGTLDLLAPALEAGALRHGLLLECVTSDYGQTAQDALSPDSAINRAGCDVVLIALDHRGLPLRPNLTDAGAARESVEEAVAFVASLREGLRRHGDPVCLVQTAPPPPEPLFGSLDRRRPGTLRSLVEAYNARLIEGLAEGRDLLFDVDALASAVGLAEWHSPGQWNMAKLPFAGAYLPLYADHAARLLAAVRGKSRRCLVLDLDNTLWGGVIGDDGLEGVVLGEGDGTGEAFLSVQRMALALRERGVVLAVSSKNDDAVARAAFQNHPEMLLRERHIAVFQANWNDKATNIAAIAAELNLGLDAFVFLDDNPAERALVRQRLPEVAVPELPEDPALYARTLSAAGYFDTVAVSEEDFARADFYQDNARRLALRESAGDLGGYLAGLDMEIDLRPFDAVGRGRIAQLIGKSNQFNLTTRRYTEGEVDALARDPDLVTLQVRLRDVFGDNGMISVLVARPAEAGVLEVDTWLMSCRVLGRGVERMVLRELLDLARARGVHTLRGVYRPSGRNAMVAEHYPRLGFVAEPGRDDAWTLPTDAQVEPAPMTVVRPAAASVAA